MNLMIQLHAQYDPELRKKIREKKLSVIIPIGSIEQHGPHLPITTDTDIVTEVSVRLAKKINALVLPAIAYGISFEHAPFFQLSVKSTTLQKQIIELCESLAKNGIKNVFVINGHHGNQKALNQINKKISNRKIKIFVFSYWHFMERGFDHAGFVETSLMLAISKNVRMNLAIKGFNDKKLNQKELAIIGKLAAKSFPKATKNGIWGDPRNASKEDGNNILGEIIKNLGKKCQSCLTA